VAIIVLLALAVGACGSGDGGGQGGPTIQSGGSPTGTPGQGQQGGAATGVVAVRPNAPFDSTTPSYPGPDGGFNAPEGTFFYLPTGERCFADLRTGAYGALAGRMTSAIEVAEARGDRPLAALAYTCLGLARLNEGALLEAARALDQAEGRLGDLPEDPKHQVDLLLLRGQMVTSAERRQQQRADGYLGRAIAVAPDQAAGLREELAAASADPTVTTLAGGTETTAGTTETTAGATETTGGGTETTAATGTPAGPGPGPGPTAVPAGPPDAPPASG
jgi:hypothetical protein